MPYHYILYQYTIEERRERCTENKKIYIFQKGFNFSQDGPGNRLVYHLAGCNLHCPWCSNPEGLFKNEKNISLSTEDVLKEVLSCKMMFFDGGGVTFTGGEVTCQKEALLTLLEILQAENIHTCIETNASLDGCKDIFKTVDYMIADFKSPIKDKLKDVTGADIDIIKSNLIFRAKTGKPLLIRVPLINGFNTGEENALLFGKFFKELYEKSGNENLYFEILTYHEFGKEKYDSLGMNYTVTNGFVKSEDIKFLAKEIKENNLKLINT